MNMTKRVAVLGELVTPSLVTGIIAVSAGLDTAPTTGPPAHPSAAVDTVAADEDPIRLTWLVRPRPAFQRSSTI
jgi:hypothetical protein